MATVTDGPQTAASPGTSGPSADAAGETSNPRVIAALVLGFLVPGAGHFLFGRRGKAIFYLITVLGCFILGMWLAEWRCVHVEKYPLYLLAQMWVTGPVLIAITATESLRITQDITYLDAGLLFTAVAGLLNIVVLVDLYETHLRIRNPELSTNGGKNPAEVRA